MEQIDLKALAKLAAACRKAGIKTYKGHGIEFTLSDDEPVKATRPSRRRTAPVQSSSKDSTTSTGAADIETDELDDYAMLMYSVAPGMDENP